MALTSDTSIDLNNVSPIAPYRHIVLVVIEGTLEPTSAGAVVVAVVDIELPPDIWFEPVKSAFLRMEKPFPLSVVIDPCAQWLLEFGWVVITEARQCFPPFPPVSCRWFPLVWPFDILVDKRARGVSPGYNLLPDVQSRHGSNLRHERDL